MVASAKSSYDAQKNDVVAAAAKFVMLDRMLAHYGPETTAPRALLHCSAENMLKRLWPESASEPVQLDPSTSPGDSLYAGVQSLTPQNEAERAFKAEAMTKAVELGEMRWLLYEQSGRSISTTLLVVPGLLARHSFHQLWPVHASKRHRHCRAPCFRAVGVRGAFPDPRTGPALSRNHPHLQQTGADRPRAFGKETSPNPNPIMAH